MRVVISPVLRAQSPSQFHQWALLDIEGASLNPPARVAPDPIDWHSIASTSFRVCEKVVVDTAGFGYKVISDFQTLWSLIMPVTPQELDDFTRFAAERLRHGENLPSLEECLRQWRADLEFQEAVADIRESLDDCSQGRLKPLDQAFDDVRRQLGLTP